MALNYLGHNFLYSIQTSFKLTSLIELKRKHHKNIRKTLGIIKLGPTHLLLKPELP